MTEVYTVHMAWFCWVQICIHLIFSTDEIVHNLKIPIMFKLFPNISISLEQIHASKPGFAAELCYTAGTQDASHPF